MKKRFFSLVCCFIFIFSISAMSVHAASVSVPNLQYSVDQDIEYFDDGSYIITEWDITPSSRTSASKTKKSTYYSSNDVAIFAVSLTGQFSYTYGSSAKATSQSVSVSIYDSAATYVTKSSSRSGAAVYGSGTVRYQGVNRTLSLQMTCSIYGNIS